jgi:cyclopropane fatty-acyl-phospholipid synthase-like methyltransferase
MDFRKTEWCPLCGRSEKHWTPFGTLELHEKEKLVSGLYEITYVKCRCGLIFHSKMMTDETILRFYQDEYRVSRPDAEDKNISRRNRLEEAFRAEKIKKYLNNRIDKVDRCLDIGCSTGKLLMSLKNKYKCEAIGVELNEQFRKQAQKDGLIIYEHLNEAQGKFDLITLIHVLEHYTRPKELLREIREMLDGYLLIEVPVPQMKPDGIHYGFNLAHPIAFITITLFRMLRETGFELVDEMKGRHLMVLVK